MTHAGRPLARFSAVNLAAVPSGPTCTRLLVDSGARVLRVDRPGGEGRERAFDDRAGLHRNRKGVAINLQGGGAILEWLAARADVLAGNPGGSA